MKPLIFVTAAVVAVVGVAAIAFAASGNDDTDANQNSQTPGVESPIPVEPDGGIGNTPGDDKPMPVEPDGGIGDTPGEEKPMPVEPGGGIGDTPGDDKPMPVEPDGGIGNTPGDETPIPVEPDGGIGDTPVTDGPIPVEPDGGIGNTPGGPQGPAQPTLPADRHTEPAPIDGLDVRIAESYPPQYFLHIVAGLPSGCAAEHGYTFTINGNDIEVEVLNSMPNGAVACTMIYGNYELNIALGSDFVSGETYTVSVNGGAAETEFTAQ